MEPGTTVECGQCGAANALPDEALRVGRFRCHACGAVADVPLELLRPRETPQTADEPVQALPSYSTSEYNTPAAMHRAELAASQPGCLVSVLPLFLLALLAWLG